MQGRPRRDVLVDASRSGPMRAAGGPNPLGAKSGSAMSNLAPCCTAGPSSARQDSRLMFGPRPPLDVGAVIPTPEREAPELPSGCGQHLSDVHVRLFMAPRVCPFGQHRI